MTDAENERKPVVAWDIARWPDQTCWIRAWWEDGELKYAPVPDDEIYLSDPAHLNPETHNAG